MGGRLTRAAAVVQGNFRFGARRRPCAPQFIEQQREAQLLRDCSDLLTRRGIAHRRLSNGGARVRNGEGPERYVQFGITGGADLLAILRPFGRWLAIECKVAGREPTDEQAEFLDAINAAGGLGLVIHDVRELAAALDELALKLEPLIAAKAKENQRLSDGPDKGRQKSAHLSKTVKTRDELAKIAGVSLASALSAARMSEPSDEIETEAGRMASGPLGVGHPSEGSLIRARASELSIEGQQSSGAIHAGGVALMTETPAVVTPFGAGSLDSSLAGTRAANGAGQEIFE